MDVFLDTGFIVSLLIETDETENARKFFNLRTLLQASRFTRRRFTLE